MTQTADKIKMLLAIYRGLPDSERADKLREWRTYPDNEARTLVHLCEQHEMSVQLERQRMSALELQLSELRGQLSARTIQADNVVHYGQVPDSGQRRGAFGFVLVSAGVGGVWYACSTLGVWPVVVGSALIFLVGSLFSGRRGEQDTDYVSGPAPAGHTVVVNVNVGNGQGTAQNGV